jgi:hypothetical protein
MFKKYLYKIIVNLNNYDPISNLNLSIANKNTIKMKKKLLKYKTGGSKYISSTNEFKCDEKPDNYVLQNNEMEIPQDECNKIKDISIQSGKVFAGLEQNKTVVEKLIAILEEMTSIISDTNLLKLKEELEEIKRMLNQY